MAKGKTHDKVTLIVSPFIGLVFFMINSELLENSNKLVIVTLFGVVTYLFGGFMFSGDLDIKSSEYYRWGKIRFIWNPYQKIFKHRSIFTHGFLLGPIIRIIYTYIIVLIVCSVLYSLKVINLATDDLINLTLEYINSNKVISINIVLALFLGSGLHTITDLFSSFIKKKFRRKNKIYIKRKNKFIA
ncbi:metal-binding protein [Clostridium septicum]|uniref:Metal-binding protein n=1 Tax=Clostridium septicum TaxID=1504 RepID=A0A9N7JNT5_CLOSE|nr:metal-binding protein [Clostridium septicum]AYE35770.1 hypothetical protein CP523_15735 [Clostridium septicum]QAS61108.1 hypothetical protein EI377_10450 [Clostridium septicum]UEC19554.1 metal-binding protein [Clostridium septicum]USS02387.1 metal-binding protein [Clostridium septicum]WLF70986.1 metal-binding protein [Clostridium septicum]